MSSSDITWLEYLMQLCCGMKHISFLQVLWLPPAKREFVKKAAPEFKQVYNDSERLRNKSGHFNVKYSYDIEDIRYEESTLKKGDVHILCWIPTWLNYIVSYKMF